MYYDNNYYNQFVCGPSMINDKPFFVEEWRYITQDVVPYVLPNRYLVSNYGFVKSAKTGKLMSINFKNGYRQVMLYGVHQKTICARIDRLVLMTFAPVPNMHSLQVNHRDTDTGRDSIDNLEWCTPKENTRYAELNGSRSKQTTIYSKRDTYYIDESVLDKVAKEIHDRVLSQRAIAEKYNISISVVEDISSGRTHRDLYEKYDLGSLKGIKPHVSEISVEQIHEMCRWLQSNPYNPAIYGSKKHYCIDAFNAVGCNKSASDFTPSNYNFVKKLATGKIYKEISCNYNLETAARCMSL